MDTQNPKRPCHDVSSSSSILNPNYLPPNFNQIDLDSTISSFLLLPDSPSIDIDCSFDRVLGKLLSSASESSGDDSVQDFLIDRTCKLASLLHESSIRFSRKRATLFNSNSWSLPLELTIKVFSMLDTKSLMQAALSCNMFLKCSMEPLCYSHIDLRTVAKRINEDVVCTMIHRAGKELRSIKLGRVTRQAILSLTMSCLTGDLLRSLHFYYLDFTCAKALCDVLAACPNLTDLKIVNFDQRRLLGKVLKSLTRIPRLIEHLFLWNHMTSPASGISCSTVEAFVSSCPNLTSLTLIGFELKEETARNLALGFPKLNYMNLSKTPGITGRFLSSDLVNSHKGKSLLKTLILRDCPSLNNVEVTQFLNSLITRNSFRFIRHIDVSNEVSVASFEGRKVSIPIPK